MKTYNATWTTSGTTGQFLGTNLKKVLAGVKEIARGNRQQGNRAAWQISETNGGGTVKAGCITEQGRNLNFK